MDKIGNNDDRVKAMEKIIQTTVDALKPGQEIKIPNRPDKAQVEEMIKKAVQKRCEREGTQFKEGEFKIQAKTDPLRARAGG